MGREKVFSFSRLQVIGISFSLTSLCLSVQGQKNFFSDSVGIRDCINYALEYQPQIKQLKIDEEIADQDVKISLSDWLPQITSNGEYQYYLQQPVSIFPNLADPTGPKIQITAGVKNYSNLQFKATQKIFNNDLYFAGRSSRYYRQRVKQSDQINAIQMVVNISKAFYDVLLSRQMLNIIIEDIDRLSKSLKDAIAMYKSGVTDRIDYNRATVALNSARSQKITVTNSITAKLTYLKQLMGYPDEMPLKLRNSFNEMKKDILIDTLQEIQYSNRIEYKLLQTNIRLQELTIGYNKQSFLPSLSGYANYNLIYQNDDFGKLYNKTFPNSSVGLSLSLPLFEGTRRIQNLKKSILGYNRLLLDTINLKSEMNSGYVNALASYKSNLATFKLTNENVDISRDVYNTVVSQYNEGIKTYLEVIVSETDLRTAQLNNLSSLILLMFSKIDVEQALGNITVDY